MLNLKNSITQQDPHEAWSLISLIEEQNGHLSRESNSSGKLGSVTLTMGSRVASSSASGFGLCLDVDGFPDFFERMTESESRFRSAWKNVLSN